MQIHMEEDLNKMMPSSKNPDGTTKLAFANLKIKDKMFILFEAKNGATPETLITTCDEFMDSLFVENAKLDSLASQEQRASGEAGGVIGDVFYRLPEDLAVDGIAYATEHLPSFIDTTMYASFDTLLTREHMMRQMQQNSEDLEGSFGEMFPELIQLDPIGMRSVLLQSMEGVIGNAVGTADDSQAKKKGGYTIIDGHIFVADSTVCLVFLSPKFSAFNTGQGNVLVEIIKKNIEKFDSDKVNITYNGTPANGYDNSTTIKSDLIVTIVGSLVVILLLLFVCFRNWDTVPLLTMPVVFGTLFGLALMYFIKGQFSLLALGIGAIVLGVAMSYVLHVLTHYKYVSDPEQVLRDEVKPVILGCLTTVGSFAGLVFINNALLQDFALFAAFAIIGTTLFALIYVPQFLSAERNKVNKKAFSLIDRINHYPFEERKGLLAVIAVVAVVCVGSYLIGGTNFDADMRNLGYSSERVRYSDDLMTEKTFTGDKQQYFASSGKTMEEALLHFSVLNHKLDSLKACGLVKSYTPLNTLFVPLTVQQQRIDAWKRYWTPERQQRARQLISETAPSAGLNAEAFDSFFDAVNADYTPDPLYEAGIIPEGYQTTMMEQSYNGEYLCFSSVTCKMDTVRGKDTDYHRICDAIANEPNLMVLDTYYYTTDSLIELNEDFNILQWLSMAFVLVVLAVSFRFNVRHTLLGFMPILVSWLIVLGAMNIFGMQFNLINIIISTFIFGIGVDYSIFVMNGLIGDQQSSDSASNRLLGYHKTAILFSAIVLIVTVASMLFATHPAIKSVGFATLVGMLSAVIISYVVQPALYKFTKKK